MQQPLANAVLSGPFEIRITAEDDLGGPVWIDVDLDGTPLATAVGPDALVGGDANELAKGPATLRIHARDEAGNASLSEVPVIIE